MQNRFRKKRFPKIVVCFLCGCMLFTGCGGSRADANGSKRSDDGRSYGGVIQVNQEQIAHTAFFDMEVTEVSKRETFSFQDGLYEPEEGNTYLVVTLSLNNTYKENLSMAITDFTLDYEGKDDELLVSGYGQNDFNDSTFMENLFTLKQGEAVTKSILFIVPDKNAYTLRYTEYYADDFVGNTYEIEIKGNDIKKSE